MTRRGLLAGTVALGACAGHGSPATQVGPVRTVTIGVEDLDAALALFRDEMGLDAGPIQEVSRARAQLWTLPRGTRGRMVELSCGGHSAGGVRLLALTPGATVPVRDDFGPHPADSPIAIGPKALDFYTATTLTDGIAAFRRRGLAPRTETPAVYPGGLEEIVFTGPGRAPLMQMSRPARPTDDMRADMPSGRFSEVATISVISADLAGSRRFYGELLGYAARFDRPAPEGFRAAVAKLVGSPPDLNAHWTIYAAPGAASAKFLLLHFIDGPKPALRGGMSPRHLGIALYTFPCGDVAGVTRRAQQMGFKVEAGPRRVDSQAMALIRGPNGELCEMVEA
jgi:catechol 2,3-dioxygenase-like lactoylglutathione lyase family enzyme